MSTLRLPRTRIVFAAVGVALVVVACSGASDLYGTFEPRLEIMERGGQAELPDCIEVEPGADLPVTDLTHVADHDDASVFASRGEEDKWCVLLPDGFKDELEDKWERVNDNLAVRR